MKNKINKNLLLLKASSLIGAKKYEEALLYCKKANIVCPNQEDVLSKYASIYELTEQWCELRDMSNNLIQRFPNSTDLQRYFKTLITSMCMLNEPIENVLPHIRSYIRGRSKLSEHNRQYLILPFVFFVCTVKYIFLLFKGKHKPYGKIRMDFESLINGASRHDKEFYNWAIDILSKHG